MRIIEFRIIVPLSIEQCHHASNYACFKFSADAKGESETEGMEFVDFYDYEDENGEKGRFSHKIMHLKSRVPAIIRWAVPDKYLHVAEISRDAFPHCTTEYKMPGVGDDCYLCLDSNHYPYAKPEDIPENSAHLTEEELKIREIRYLDILDGPVGDKTVLLNDFEFPAEGIQKLVSDHKPNEKELPHWVQNYKGTMICAVKTVKFNFKWWGIQTAVEAFVLNSIVPQVLLDNHRGMVAWAPDWSKITPKQLEEMIDERKAQDQKKTYD